MMKTVRPAEEKKEFLKNWNAYSNLIKDPLSAHKIYWHSTNQVPRIYHPLKCLYSTVVYVQCCGVCPVILGELSTVEGNHKQFEYYLYSAYGFSWTPFTVLMVSLQSSRYLPQNWIPFTVLMVCLQSTKHLHRTEHPSQYWWYPFTALNIFHSTEHLSQ